MQNMKLQDIKLLTLNLNVKKFAAVEHDETRVFCV